MRLATHTLRVALSAASSLFLFAAFLGASTAPMAQTTLAPGDIAVIGFSSDDDGDDTASPTPEDDEFALLALVDIEVGTPISITDKGVTSDGTLQTDGESVRGFVTKEAISAGDVFIFTRSRTTQTFPSAFGEPESGGSSFGFGLSTSGDQIIVFQENGDGSNTYIYALSTTPFDAAYAASPRNDVATALPPGLTNGSTAIDFEDDENIVDNVYYDRTNGVGGSRAALLGLVSNDDNYVQENSGDGFTLGAMLGDDAFTFYPVAAVPLPVTFEESIDYSLNDFEGTMSVLATDPTDATNTVVRTVRSATAQCFAGTTVGESALAFEEPIPFTANATTMSVRVWSPEAGALVLLKVEQQGNPGIFVETYTYTTVADAYETLVFDFADPKPNTLGLDFNATYNKVTIFFDFQCDNVPATTLAAMDRTYYWDDVAFGSVMPPMGPETFTALLRGGNEVPAVATDAKGGATVVLDGTQITVTGSFAGLESDFTGAHIHGGSDSENKPVVQALNATLNADNRGGTFEAMNNTYTVRETFADSIRAGLAYVNVHSTGNASGEIRGQVGTAIQTLPFALSGANEVPPVETDATGSGTVSLDGSMVTVTGSFSGLQSDYNTVVGSHIHGGAADENGGVVVALSPTLDADNRGGTWAAADNMFEVRTTFADSIRAGLAYVNVHSIDNASGEVRGQIGTPAPAMVLTIAEARAAGVGEVVTVEGTVTRAAGDFTYIQDATGGLAIRQTDDAADDDDFFDNVADGTVAPGTTLRVTGTLSEFRQLLQINEGDLASYEVLGTGEVPAPQTVTLSELAANGEDYEGELVTVDGVTFTETGSFAAATTYDVTDATDATNAVSVRVPNAGDTTVDGTPIPARANLTAVVGQFDFDDPAAGYQLLLLDAADVANAVANEGGAGAELTLTVANPVRQSAAVRFTLAAPGEATVALYDALGRRVAVLAAGEVGAGVQTARLDAAGLATGVYVLRLEAEGGSVTKAITVVR